MLVKMFSQKKLYNPDNVIRVGGLKTGGVVFEICGHLGLNERCYCVAMWEV